MMPGASISTAQSANTSRMCISLQEIAFFKLTQPPQSSALSSPSKDKALLRRRNYTADCTLAQDTKYVKQMARRSHLGAASRTI